MYPIGSVTVRSASANRKAFTYNENNKKHDNNKKGDVFMNKKNETVGGWNSWSLNDRPDERECLCT